MAASAGQVRASDTLIREVASGDFDDLQSQLVAKLSSDAARDQYLPQGTAEDDLQAAIARIQAATTSPDISSAAKSTMLAQLGAAQMMLSEVRLAALETDIQALTNQSIILQDRSYQALVLGTQADTLARNNPAPTPENLNQAKVVLTAAEQALNAAQANVRRLQNEIGSRETQSRTIYSQTDAAFLAADLKRGQEAIDAGLKAMADRRRADELMAEIGNLQPQLALAQSQAAIAQVQFKDAQSKVDIETRSLEAATASYQSTTRRITSLRADARAIIEGDAGVAAVARTFKELADGLDARIQGAVDAAEAAARSYSAAASEYAQHRQNLGSIVSERLLDTSDPLAKVAKDERMRALLAWSRAAALSQSARASLAGHQGTLIAEAALTGVAQAQRAAQLQPVAVGNAYRDAARNLKSAATAKFAEAVEAAKQGNGITAPGIDLDNIKWIGFGIESIASHGLFLSGQRRTDLTAAVNARTEAVRRNPQLQAQLGWIDQ